MAAGALAGRTALYRDGDSRMSAPTAAVVIATYNEAETIGEILDILTPHYTCVVVDDSSPDGTADIARDYQNVIVIQRPGKMGIASAYIRGMQAALRLHTDYIVQMDAGGTHQPGQVASFIRYAREYNVDLVIGSRFLYTVEWRGYRTLISWCAALLMRLRGVNVADATSGFRCWRSSLLYGLDFDAIKAKGFAFQIETLMQAHNLGAQIDEMQIPYALTNSSFNWRMVREALRVYGGFWL